MKKKYQVFVSSTYRDLVDERSEIIQALLELECIPSGMELFPAADDDQWTLIKKIIDDCDYYIVVIAGRYGSCGPNGISYTQMEYEYALESGKPIIGFLHKEPTTLPAGNCEDTPEGREKLSAFRELVQKKVVRFWTSPAELGSVVSRSLIQLMSTKPAIGWVRADAVPDESAALEILRLRKKIDMLEAAASSSSMENIENLAQGEDKISLKYTLTAMRKRDTGRVQMDSNIEFSWNEIFYAVSPIMMNETSELSMKNAVNDLILDNIDRDKLFISIKDQIFPKIGVELSEGIFQTIKIQLRALGLIGKQDKNKFTWILTDRGDSVMTSLRAIKRKTEASGT